MKNILNTIRDILRANRDRRDTMRLNIMAILAGFYISLGSIFMLNVHSLIESNVKVLIGGIVFSIGLILCVFGEARLFTGLCFRYGLELVSRTRSVLSTFDILLKSWLFNFVGAVWTATLFMCTGLNERFLNALQTISQNKVNYSISDVISKGIFCNILVCLAIFLSNKLDNSTTKFLCICFCVTMFITCGFEHSVANMFILTLAWFHKFISMPELFYNISLSTIGNLIGGLLVAKMYCDSLKN